LLEFHKSAEFARSFSDRLEELHQARLQFSQQAIEYTVRYRGEDSMGMFAVDEARKDLKHQALNLAYYVETIAQQVEATSRTDPSKLRSTTIEPARSDAHRGAGPTTTEGITLLQQFAASLADYSSVLNRVILEAYHPEVESFEDAMAWMTGRQAELEAARQSIDGLAGRQLTAAVIPPEGARSDEWTVQLMSLVAESFHAVSYVFTSGPPQSKSDDPRAKMAASVVSRQLEAASKLLREIDTRRRHIEATCLALRPDQSCPGEAKLASRRFESGEIVFYSDRVELGGVDICSGSRSGSRRIVLELLSRRRSDGAFVAYSGDDLEAEAKRHGAKGTASGWIRDLRDTVVIALRKQMPSTVAGQDEVILSGGPGYRFAESISVQFRDPPMITDIRDTDEASDVPNEDVRDVFDVRDDAAGARHAWILQELAKARRLKAPDVAEHFGCSVKTAQRDLTALKDEGKIEFVGAPRTGFYRLRQAP
jgi:HPt (histidine-containing phosphotransfer) domain-containing protein